MKFTITVQQRDHKPFEVVDDHNIRTSFPTLQGAFNHITHRIESEIARSLRALRIRTMNINMPITGIEPDPDHSQLLRVYVGPRYEWNYLHARTRENLSVGQWITVNSALVRHDAARKAETARQFSEAWMQDYHDFEVIGA